MGGRLMSETKRRLVEVSHEARCPKTGELIESTPTGERKWIILHTCGEWTWEDANFCGGCGKRLENSDV